MILKRNRIRKYRARCCVKYAMIATFKQYLNNVDIWYAKAAAKIYKNVHFA